MEPVEEPLEEHTPSQSFGYRFARALPFVVGARSVLALLNSLGSEPAGLNYASLLMAVLGLSGTALYFWRQRQQQSIEPALTLFWVWAILQLVIITRVTQAAVPVPFTREEPIWDTSQLLKLTFKMGFNTSVGSQIVVALNFVPFLFFAWIRRLRVAENFGE